MDGTGTYEPTPLSKLIKEYVEQVELDKSSLLDTLKQIQHECYKEKHNHKKRIENVVVIVSDAIIKAHENDIWRRGLSSEKVEGEREA